MDKKPNTNSVQLPGDLPVPADDGAAEGIVGREIPGIEFASTDGAIVDLGRLASEALVLYVFPGMTAPDRPDPEGWRAIPGAYGCTQQSCAFRDRREEIAQRGFRLAGLSAQATDVQQEAQGRLRLGFPLLADPDLELAAKLHLPTFTVENSTLYRRLTLIARKRVVVKVFYPVFPPNENAAEVLRWLQVESGRV